MAKSLHEQRPTIVARGWQPVGKVLLGQSRMVRKRHKHVNGVENAAAGWEVIKDRCLVDGIVGKPVKDGLEDREVVQAFSGMRAEGHDDPRTGQSRTRGRHKFKAGPGTYKTRACCVVESRRCGMTHR